MPRDDLGFFARRVFWLKDHDRDSDPTGCYATDAPAEAVDPRAVRPMKSGVAATPGLRSA